MQVTHHWNQQHQTYPALQSPKFRLRMLRSGNMYEKNACLYFNSLPDIKFLIAC